MQLEIISKRFAHMQFMATSQPSAFPAVQWLRFIIAGLSVKIDDFATIILYVADERPNT